MSDPRLRSCSQLAHSERVRSMAVVLLVVACIVSTLVVPVSASTIAEVREETTGQSKLDQLRAQVERHRGGLDDPYFDWGIFAGFTHSARNLLDALAKEPSEAAEREAAALERERIAVAERWIRERPQDIGGYQVVLQHAATEAEVAALIERVEAHFADSRVDIESVASELKRLSWTHASWELLESYADRHPRDAKIYPILLKSLESRQVEARAAEWARRWAERLPDDHNAQLAYFRYYRHELSADQIESLAERLLEGVTDSNQREFCLQVEKAGAAQVAARCWQKILAIKPYLRLEEMRSLVRAFGTIGEHDALIELARKEDAEWQRNAMSELGRAGHCRLLESMVAEFGKPTDLNDNQLRYFRRELAQSMTSCGLAQAGAATLALFRDAPTNEVPSLVNRQRLVDVDRADLEQVLLERLMEQPGQKEIHQALASFYSQTGQAEKLLAHAVDWASHRSSDAEPRLLAAELLLASGQMDRVAPWIEAFLQVNPPEYWYWARAFTVLDGLGETGWASQIATRLTGSDEPTLAAAGHRHLLRLEDGAAGGAGLRRFEAIREQGQANAFDKAAYASGMRAHGRLSEVLTEIEGDVLAKNGPAGSSDLMMARELAYYELWDEAAARYAAAVEASPDDPQVHHERARILGELGDEAGAEQSYRRILELAPRHKGALEKLAYMLQGREQFQEIVDLLEPVENDLSAYAGLLLGHALMRLERLDEAAAALEKAAMKQPQNYAAQLNLATVYAALERVGDAERTYRRFLRMTDWSVTRTGDCNCSCGLPGQRAAVREWLAEHGTGS